MNLGLSKEELKEMEIISVEINKNPTSEKSLEIRKQFFNKKQKIGKIRYWFSRFPTIMLQDDELTALKSIAFKPKNSNWEIVFNILKNQHHLTEEQLIEWFELTIPSSQLTLAPLIIKSNTIKNVDLKLKAINMMLGHSNYIFGVIDYVSTIWLIAPKNEYVERIIASILEKVNGGGPLAERTADILLSRGKGLEIVAASYDVVSQLLFEKTKKTIYLRREARDVFDW